LYNTKGRAHAGLVTLALANTPMLWSNSAQLWYMNSNQSAVEVLVELIHTLKCW